LEGALVQKWMVRQDFIAENIINFIYNVSILYCYTERNISAARALKLLAAPFTVVIACTTPQIVVRPALILIKLKIHQISVS